MTIFKAEKPIFYPKVAKDATPKVVYETKWFQILNKNGWEYYHNRKASSGVSVLIFDEPQKKILGRFESVPCHDPGHYLIALTGMLDHENEPKETAVREVKEEAGITATPNELLDLGYIYPSKDSDYCLLMYGLNGAGKKLGKATGDGSKAEKNSYVRWVPVEEAIASHAPSIGASICKLKLLGVDLFPQPKK